MAKNKNRNNLIFIGFFISIIIIIFYTRPFNSQWHKFIDGDGLGYYSYLPAKYIYDDTNYEFKWFNEIHKKNYQNCAFDEPIKIFMVEYKHTQINKYYQGLSFLWLPFFAVGHLVAKAMHFPADGYSLPYQLSIGFASLFYVMLGLFYLRKLIFKWCKNDSVAVITTLLIFYGTNLFYYSLYLNSQSHQYSFTFIVLFLYATYSFFNEQTQQLKWFLFAILFFVTIICVRPINGLILIAVPVFIQSNFFNKKIITQSFKWYYGLIILLTGLLLFNQLSIIYTQTHSFFVYTYTNEKFYFFNPKFFNSLFSYHIGIFIYTPLLLLALCGVYYLKQFKQKFILISFIFLVMYIYSSWWFWVITTRAIIDYYALFAILLATLLTACWEQKIKKYTVICLSVLCVFYFQLKSYQIHNGILDEFYTHKELFWKHFFRTKPCNIYSIPPLSIIKQKTEMQNFETNTYKGRTSVYYKKAGNLSAVLDSIEPFSNTFDFKLPLFMNEVGVKKIRFSFWFYATDNIKSAQIYLKLFNKNDSLLKEIPFYMTPQNMVFNQWDLKEFGCEITNQSLLKNTYLPNNIDHVSIFIWNNHNDNALYLDDVKTEFVLCNTDFENIKL